MNAVNPCDHADERAAAGVVPEPPNPEGIEGRLRAKAINQLTKEVGQAIDGVRAFLRTGSSDGYRVRCKVSAHDSGALKVLPEANGAFIVTVDLHELLLNILAPKAIANFEEKRGDEAVEAFMNRVESVHDEIEQLRSEVIG